MDVLGYVPSSASILVQGRNGVPKWNIGSVILYFSVLIGCIRAPRVRIKDYGHEISKTAIGI